jgi:hypothetical protein
MNLWTWARLDRSSSVDESLSVSSCAVTCENNCLAIGEEGTSLAKSPLMAPWQRCTLSQIATDTSVVLLAGDEGALSDIFCLGRPREVPTTYRYFGVGRRLCSPIRKQPLQSILRHDSQSELCEVGHVLRNRLQVASSSLSVVMSQPN